MPDDDDDEYDKILADYAAGHDVAAIEQRYGVSRAEIEWLVAEDARSQPDRPATPAPPRGTIPPAPVLVAVALLGLGAVGQLVFAVVLVVAGGWPLVPCFVLGVAVGASAAYGLWRGWRGAQVVTVVLGVMLLLTGMMQLADSDFGLVPIVAGVALALLLLVPGSARTWFRR